MSPQSTVLTPPSQSQPKEKGGDEPGKSGASLNTSYSAKIDHLRFLAASWIAILHTFCPIYAVLAQVPCDWNVIMPRLMQLDGIWFIPRALLVESQLSVGMFLTISGFLFAKITDKNDILTGKFYVNRLLRIYPLYMTFILLALFLNPGPNPFSSLCLSVLTLQHMGQAVNHPMITPPFWSVAVEFQIYLLFPVMLAEFRSKGMKALLLFLAAAIGLKAVAYLMTGDVQGIAVRSAFGRIDQFLIGMMFGYGFKHYAPKIKNPIFFGLSIVALVTGICIFHAYGGNLHTARKSIWIFWPALESLLCGAMLAAYCATDLSLPKKLSTFFAFLGGISYSIYITHYFVSVVVTHRLCGPFYNFNRDVLIPIFGNSGHETFVLSVLFGMLVIVPITCLVSCVTYYAIEKPFMNRRVKYTVPIATTKEAA